MRNCLAFIPALLVPLILPITMQAQNLVPNPGFEQLNACPNSAGAISYDPSYTSFPYIPGWTCPLNGASPDAFNTCSPANSGVQVPESDWGFQYPRSGNGFAGIIAWQGTHAGGGWPWSYREYLQCRLLQPLNPGQRYCVTFYVNNAIATVTTHNNFNFVGIDEVGINFSVSKPTQSSGVIMPLQPHISNTAGNFFTDTTTWRKVTGIYTASGGEEWLTVGCFAQAIAPNFIPVHPTTPSPVKDYRSYLYFDDFSVVPIMPGDTVKRSFDSLACKKDGFAMVLPSPGGDEGEWNNGTKGTSLTVDTPGTYWCRSEYDCQLHIDTFHVIYDSNKILNLGADTGNCENLAILLKPNGGFANILWSTGETKDTITVSQSGTYYISATNECGVQQDTINVFIQPPTDPPVVSDTAVCQFTSNPSLNVSGTNLNWYTHKHGLFGFPHQPLITTTQPGSFTFYVSNTIDKCESEKVPMTIKVRYTPHKMLPAEAKMCEKFPDSIGTWYPEVNYTWSTGERACCIIPRYEGLYRLATSNECGTFVDSIRVDFSLCDTCIFVPNAFTPNRDGSNDLFKAIITCPIQDFNMKIFNRWGQVVFSTTDVNEGWYGYYNHLPCDDGVYIYLIQYHSLATKNPKMLKGNVTLIR